jgi:hypothetical protein
MSARAWIVAGCTVVLGGLTPARPAVDLVRPEEMLLALYTLETQLELEAAVLNDLRGDYEGNLSDRDRYQERLDRLYAELEAGLVVSEEQFQPAEIKRRDEELERLEKAQTLAWDEGRRLRRGMLDVLFRMRKLRERVADVLDKLPEAGDSLTGYWDVVLLAGEARGIFYLTQSAAVITGEYVLEGGYRGSLEGTIIGGKVVLKRIDSQLGRIMDLDGMVSPDGQSIQGTWQRISLGGGRHENGSWSASRRAQGEQSGGP